MPDPYGGVWLRFSSRGRWDYRTRTGGGCAITYDALFSSLAHWGCGWRFERARLVAKPGANWYFGTEFTKMRTYLGGGWRRQMYFSTGSRKTIRSPFYSGSETCPRRPRPNASSGSTVWGSWGTRCGGRRPTFCEVAFMSFGRAIKGCTTECSSFSRARQWWWSATG